MALPKEDLARLILRVSLGVHMAGLHGWGKLTTFSAKYATFSDPLGIGHRNSMIATVAAEFVCAILVAIGLFTRVAAAGLVFTMGVAGLVVHWASPWAKKELALVFLTGFLVVLLLGPGRYSLDALLLPRLFRRGGGGAVPRGRR